MNFEDIILLYCLWLIEYVLRARSFYDRNTKFSKNDQLFKESVPVITGYNRERVNSAYKKRLQNFLHIIRVNKKNVELNSFRLGKSNLKIHWMYLTNFWWNYIQTRFSEKNEDVNEKFYTKNNFPSIIHFFFFFLEIVVLNENILFYIFMYIRVE